MDDEYCGLIRQKGRGLSEKLTALTSQATWHPLGEFWLAVD